MDRMIASYFLLALTVITWTSAQEVETNYEPHVKITSAYPRSCFHAMSSSDPAMRDSGMYWIDPDGLGIGDGPIYVYCDMTTGVTAILHDAEDEMHVPVCLDKPECYKIDINYQNVTKRQLRALAEISAECHQSIEVNCMRGPLHGTSQNFAWWLDSKGTPQYFWTGDGTTGDTCQCGIDGNCLLPDLKCNCDANVAIPLTDSGKITNKELLPMTGLRFSNTAYEGGSHKVGRFECSGLQKAQTTEKGEPKSCKDLWLLGQTVNGVYITSDISNNGAEVVFYAWACDFQDSNDIVSRTQIGTWKGTQD